MKRALRDKGTLVWNHRRTVGIAAVVAMAGLARAIGASAESLPVPACSDLYIGMAASGHVAPGYLGVNLRDVPDDQSPKSASSAPRGAEILHLDHDGPAGKAGLREHDIILSINGQTVESAEPLKHILRDMAPGRSVTLVISRAGQQQTFTAQMANREDLEKEAWEGRYTVTDPQIPAASPPPPADERRGFFSTPGRVSRSLFDSMNFSSTYTGAMLEALGPQLAEYFGAQGRTGLLVDSVNPNSPAANAGLHAGDVVVRVNNSAIASTGDWTHAVRESKGRSMNVVVMREHHEQTLILIPTAKRHSSLLPEFWPRMGNSFRGSTQPLSSPVEASASPEILPM